MVPLILHLSAFILTYLFFGYLGLRFSKKFKQPDSILTATALVLLTIGAIRIGPHAMILGIFEFKIFVNNALQATGIGIIAGLLIGEKQQKKQVEGLRS